MFCKYCGKEIKDTAAFCPACGKATGNAEQKQEQQKEYQAGRRGGDGIVNMGGTQTVDLYALVSMLVSFVTVVLAFVYLYKIGFSDVHIVLFVVAILFAVCAIVFGTMAKRRNGISPMARAGRIIGIICLVFVPSILIVNELAVLAIYTTFTTMS